MAVVNPSLSPQAAVVQVLAMSALNATIKRLDALLLRGGLDAQQLEVVATHAQKDLQRMGSASSIGQGAGLVKAVPSPPPAPPAPPPPPPIRLTPVTPRSKRSVAEGPRQ